MKERSIQSITNSILELENKYDLLNWKIDNVFIWQIARVPIYIKLQESIDQEYQATSKSLESRIIGISKSIYERIIINSIFHNPFFKIKQTDAIVFESSRKYLVENDYIDIYTKYLCLYLENKGKNQQVFQSTYSFDRLAKSRRGTKHLDFVSLISQLRSNFLSIGFSNIDIKKVEAIQQELFQTFSVKINLLRIFEKLVRKYKAEYPLYKKLFSLYKPKEIYLVNFCDKPAIIAAAKNKGITVIEMQHGLMVKEDLIFHFPNSEKGSVAYFPDKFFVWEKFWGNSALLPITNKNIVEFGNRHMVSQSAVLQTFKKEANTILIISQKDLTDDIFRIIFEKLSDLVGYNLFIKMHPLEFGCYKKANFYRELVAADNVKFIENEVSIYQLMAKSTYCIGVFSAALIESIYFNSKLLLLDLPGVEMLQFLVDRNLADVIKHPYNFTNALNI